MVVQFQAGYLLEGIRSTLEGHYMGSKNEKEHYLGLLEYLCTFDCITTLDLKVVDNVKPVYAVAANIVARGLPTKTSVKVEEFFVHAFNETERLEERGAVKFNLRKDSRITAEKLFQAMHVIDPRGKDRRSYLDFQMLDSNFERSFLTSLIPVDHSFLAQLFEQQRKRGSLVGTANEGRVDFCLEIPYQENKTQLDRYRQSINIKRRKRFVVEVDGAKYHTALADDFRDFAIADLANEVNRIREGDQFTDSNALIHRLSKEQCIEQIRVNFNNPDFLQSPELALGLAPIGIARIQFVVLRLLMNGQLQGHGDNATRLAIIERDLPCGLIAIEDLIRQLAILNQLSESPIDLPKIDVNVFGTSEFLNHPLRAGKPVRGIEHFQLNDFDMVLDISLLRRSNIFRQDSLFESPKTIVIRNAHHIDISSVRAVVCAAPVIYKDLVVSRGNEIYEELPLEVGLLSELLANIFRKTSFREGQLPILNRALKMKSVIGLLPTGGGKSLTYQLAAMLQPGIAIVIDPIRSLMIDQYQGLKDIGIDQCGYINSTLNPREKRYFQNELFVNARSQFVFVSPERFVMKEFREALSEIAANGHCFAYIVIDEVHCVSEWGHDFRTPYLNLGENTQSFCKPHGSLKKVPIFGLTATASFDVLTDIERELKIESNDGNAIVRFENSNRDELNFCIESVKITPNNPHNLNEWKLKELIGGAKQEKIIEILSSKEAWLRKFNIPNIIHRGLRRTFAEYLPLSQRARLQYLVGIDKAEQFFVEERTEHLFLNEGCFKKTEQKYDYGLIAFMPHRSGWFGIKEKGLFDRLFREDTIGESHFGVNLHESIGYFMGSGDDNDAERIDKESFEHLSKFKNNEESLMIATKAFGMGIDKANVRMTIHINMPQSIESFVQEAGRAGRDGKTSVSVVVYNDQKDWRLVENRGYPYHLDKELLLYFHDNAFKGKAKEKVMWAELLKEIIYPNRTTLDLLVAEINKDFDLGDSEIQLRLPEGNILYVNDDQGSAIGKLQLRTKGYTIDPNFRSPVIANQIFDWLKREIFKNPTEPHDHVRIRLNQQLMKTVSIPGIETELSQMVNSTGGLEIPFTNGYYSKRTKSIKSFKLNEKHLELVCQSGVYKTLFSKNPGIETHVKEILQTSVFKGKNFRDFAKLLLRGHDELLKAVLEYETPISKEFRTAYYAPRSQADTAKAIYRLASIGIIDSYTIDYYNGLYEVAFTKQKSNSYFRALQTLLSRYTSQKAAENSVDQLKEQKKQSLEAKEESEIGICLNYLTNYVYDRIKAKRKQGIEDMVRLCDLAVTLPDVYAQNAYIKDEIFYYFNAKYSRVGYKERTDQGELTASLSDDVKNGEAIRPTIRKFTDLVENAETGEFVGNVKHMRGSVMRLLRDDPDNVACLILKAFALFCLADYVDQLKSEAISSLEKGLEIWLNHKTELVDVPEFIDWFKSILSKHVKNYDWQAEITDIENYFLVRHFQKKTSELTTRLLA